MLGNQRGPGCANCTKMEELTKTAVQELGIEAMIEKIADIGQIAMHGILSTPGLIVNGKIGHSGKPLSSLDKVKELIQGESVIWCADQPIHLFTRSPVHRLPLHRKTMNELTIIFKALSDETRLRIIKLLEQGELCVCDITAALDMVQPKVSFHLNTLKEAGFLRDRKQGKWIHYSINDKDLFRRMLIVSACERMDDSTAKTDRKRLDAFIGAKESGGKVVPLKPKVRCCG